MVGGAGVHRHAARMLGPGCLDRVAQEGGAQPMPDGMRHQAEIAKIGERLVAPVELVEAGRLAILVEDVNGDARVVEDAGKLGIGVDSNQNGLQPGKVLTSMVKRVDVAVYNAFKDAQDGKFTPGLNNLGLKEDGVGYAMDDNNKALVTDEMKAAAEKAKADIIAGTIQVHDYMADESCPAAAS